MKSKNFRSMIVMIAAAFVVGLVVNLALAQQVVVKRKDGRTVRGDLVSQTDEQVTLNVDGIPTSIKRSDIESIDDVESIEDLYRERRSRIKDDDVDGRYELAKWLYDQKAFRLALEELDDLRKRFPNDRRVRTLAGIVANRAKLDQGDPNTTAPGGSNNDPQPGSNSGNSGNSGSGGQVVGGQQGGNSGAGTGAGGAGVKVFDDIPTELLSQDAINLIKLYEVDLTEQPPVRIPREVIESLFKDYAGNELIPKDRAGQLEFRRLPGWQQLEIIFRLQAREFYPKIDVRVLPPALRTFKSTIQRRYALSYCATVGCHGGKEAGKFFLFTKRANEDATAFTNFYILSEYRNQDGDMIDRGTPERSLLIQYGLPREAAATPHPDVPGWQPAFRTDRDRQYQLIREWLGSGLYSPKPDYGIDYPLPQIAPPAKPPAAPDASEAAPSPSEAPEAPAGGS